MTERLRTKGPSFFDSIVFVILPLDGYFDESGSTLFCFLETVLSRASLCRGVLLLEIVEESETKVSESELLQHELSDRWKWLCREAEVMWEDLEEVLRAVDALDEAREEVGLDRTKLLLLTVRTLLRLLPRLISTTSMEGGRTALGMILDRYAA